MSTAEPFGTWHVGPQRVCVPAGARVGSNRLCCATSTNGRSGPPAPDLRLGRDDLRQRPPTCTVAARGTRPRAGTGPASAQSTLNDPGPVAEPLERATVAPEPVAREREELPRVTSSSTVARRRSSASDRRSARLDLAPSGGGGDERVGDRLRAAPGERPADRVAGGESTRPNEAAPAPRGAASSARRCPRGARGRSAAKQRASPSPGGAPQPEAGERATGGAARERPEDPRAPRPARRAARQSPPASPSACRARRGRLERALEHHRGAVVERVRERRRRMDPLEAVLGERQRAKEGRGERERVDRRASSWRKPAASALPCAARHRGVGPSSTSTERPARGDTIAAARPFGPVRRRSRRARGGRYRCRRLRHLPVERTATTSLFR